MQLLIGTDFFGHEVDDRFRKLGGPFEMNILRGNIQNFHCLHFS